jgi:uncharacterized iron-regulated membrane protein
VILSLSRIVYLFKPQIDSVFYGHQRNVDARSATLSYAKQLAAVKTALPGATVTSVAPPPNAKRSTQFGVTRKTGKDWTVFVDPYTGTVLGHRDNRRYVPTIALDVHGSLLASRFMDADGTWGDRIIELAASWAVVLVITGLYLWWPRGRRRSLRRALTPRLRARSVRVRWRDVHAVTGGGFSFVFLFFLVTGLARSGVWGQTYKDVATKVGSSYPPGTFDGVPSKTVEDVVKGGKPAWAAGSLPVMPSAGAGGGRPGHTGHNDHAALRCERSAGTRTTARRLTPSWPVRSRWACDRGRRSRSRTTARRATPSASFPTTTSSPTRTRSTSALRSSTSTRPSRSEISATASPAMAQATDLGIALHEGRQFGLVNQVLALLGTLALLLSCATAIVMWRNRRPKGIGAPRRAPNRRLGAGVVAITLGLGVFFPLLGISILALLIFDVVLVKHVPPLRRALGAC